MTKQLDLADIQCNVVRDLGGGFSKARFAFIHIPQGRSAAARAFLMDYRGKVTNALKWDSKEHSYPGGESKGGKPPVAINLAISWWGLESLGVPRRTLAKMPTAFIDGMAARARILGDPTVIEKVVEADPTVGKDPTFANLEVERPDGWDPIWVGEKRVHIMVGLNGQMDATTGKPVQELEQETVALVDLCRAHGLVILDGHRNPDPRFQDASAIVVKTPLGFVPIPKEHFGFTDGFGNPVFEGQHEEAGHSTLAGNGKMVVKGNRPFDWKPLATGEFLLGHADEAQEIPATSVPPALMRNGTFLIYRKLHQNVRAFRTYIATTAKAFAQARGGIPEDDAGEWLMAKIVGRWSDGVPVALAPTVADWHDFHAKYPYATAPEKYRDFRFGDDPDGRKCPLASHLRRVNTRDSLDPAHGGSSTLNNRRRILRRGLPYGQSEAPQDDDTSEHGVVFMALCASIERQFEFIQQQWLQYGLDANVGSDDCPLLGARQGGDAKFVIPVDPEGGEAPFICSGLPKFVETRGGEYFFMPSMTALRMIGMGVVDPT